MLRKRVSFLSLMFLYYIDSYCIEIIFFKKVEYFVLKSVYLSFFDFLTIKNVERLPKDLG